MLTYADWNDYSDLLADGFASRGLGAGDVIAVRCCSRIEWAVIALAAAKIDASILSLDPSLPGAALRERLIAGSASALILGDTDPGAVSSALLGLPLRLRASMDATGPGFFNFWDLFPPAAPARFGWSQPSVIAWSAGVAGKAQCVQIPRRRAAPASMSREPQHETGVTLITIPFHRGWSATQFWGALGSGHAIVLMRDFDPLKALAEIERRRVTHWAAWPETFQKLVSLPPQALTKADCSSLVELTIGGAPASWPLKCRIVSAFGPILSEAYGSTEAGIIALMPAVNRHERPGSCGRPIRGVMVEIRGSDGHKLPPDSVGEIWARTSRSLACSWMGRRLRSLRDEAGFIATGDAGRIDGDGFLYVTGRAQDLPGWDLRCTG